MCARSNRVTSDRYSIKFDACNVLNQRPFLGDERKTSARAECFLNGIHNVIMQMLKVIPADLSAIETVGGLSLYLTTSTDALPRRSLASCDGLPVGVAKKPVPSVDHRSAVLAIDAASPLFGDVFLGGLINTPALRAGKYDCGAYSASHSDSPDCPRRRR